MRANQPYLRAVDSYGASDLTLSQDVTCRYSATFEADNKQQIFISHKSRDKAAALRIRTTLEKFGGNSMDVFVSEQIEPGKEWPSVIWEHLLKADWLLLLYTDESEEWDWCLFEAGFFAAKGKGCNKGLVCLHVTEVLPPKPLSLWQTVKVYESDSMDGFVEKLYTGVNDKVVKSEELRKQVGDEIAAAFAKTVRRRTERRYETNCLVLSLSPAQVGDLIETGNIPEGAIAGRNASESLDLFGHDNSMCFWVDLEQGIDKKLRRRWTRSLGNTLRKVAKRDRPIPPIPIFYSSATNSAYNPALHRIDRYSDGSMDFCLIFVPKVPESEIGRTQELRITDNMLRLGRKFRWKLLHKYRREIALLNRKKQYGEAEDMEIPRTLERLTFDLDWIIGEAQRYGLELKEDVLAAFPDAADQEVIEDIIDSRWPLLMRKVYQGIQDRDLDLVLNVLNCMLVLNKTFMVRTAQRYCHLLQDLKEPRCEI